MVHTFFFLVSTECPSGVVQGHQTPRKTLETEIPRLSTRAPVAKAILARLAMSLEQNKLRSNES